MRLLSLKLKTVVPCLIIGSSSILSLSSCIHNKDNLPYDNLVEFDKEYGYDQAKYSKLVKAFSNEYKYKISRADSIHKQDDAFVAKSMAQFDKEIAHLNDSFDLKQKQNGVQLSWTSKSDALLAYANNTYKIVLSAVTEDWDSTLNNIFNSYMDTLSTYMDNLKLNDDQRHEQRRNFSQVFENIKESAKMKYGTVIESLPYVRDSLDSAIISINDDCSYLATLEQLKLFLDNYKIEPIATPAENYYWDKLKVNPRFGAAIDRYDRVDISEYIEYIFTFSRKIEFEDADNNSDPATISDGSYADPFKPDADQLDGVLIPGFKLTPILKNMNADPNTNTYTISIDWELINKNDELKPNRESLTAHSSVVKKEISVEDDLVKNDAQSDASQNYSSVVENYNTIDDSDKQFSEYILPITRDYEIQMLKATYFNDTAVNKISFGFDADENLAYDTYLYLYSDHRDLQEENKTVETGDGESKIYTFTLSAENLGDIGVTINGQRLDNLLEENKSDENQEDSYEYADIDNIDVNDYSSMNESESEDSDADIPTTSTPEQTFLANCDIWAKVELDPKDENRFVKNFIYFAYKNTTISRDDMEKKYLNNAIILEKESMTISDKLFELAQSYYNDVSEVAHFYDTLALSIMRWTFLIQAGMYVITLASSYFAASKLSAKFFGATVAGFGAGVLLAIFWFALLIVVKAFIWATIPVGVYLFIVLAYIASICQTIVAVNAITEKSNFYKTYKDDESKLIFFMKSEFNKLTLDQMCEKINYYSKLEQNEEYLEYIRPYYDEGVNPEKLGIDFTNFVSPLSIVQTVMGYWSTAQGIITIPLMVDPSTREVHFISNITAGIWSFVKGAIHSIIFGYIFQLIPKFLAKWLIPKVPEPDDKTDDDKQSENT